MYRRVLYELNRTGSFIAPLHTYRGFIMIKIIENSVNKYNLDSLVNEDSFSSANLTKDAIGGCIYHYV